MAEERYVIEIDADVTPARITVEKLRRRIENMKAKFTVKSDFQEQIRSVNYVARMRQRATQQEARVRERLARAEQRAAEQRLRMEERVDRARRRVSERESLQRGVAGDQVVEIRAEIQTLEARRQLAILEKDREVELKVDADITAAKVKLALLQRQMRNTGKRKIFGDFGESFGAVFTSFGRLLGVGNVLTPIISSLSDNFGAMGKAAGGAGGSVGQLGGAMAGAGPAIAGLIAALQAMIVVLGGVIALVLALAASLGTAILGFAAATAAALALAVAVGVGLFASFQRVTQTVELFNKANAAAQLAMTGTAEDAEKAATAIAEYQSNYDSLTPAAQKFTDLVTGQLVPAWGALRESAEGSFLPGITAGIQNLFQLAPRVTQFIEQLGQKIGSIFESVTSVFAGSPAVSKFLESLLKSVDALSPGITAFASAFTTLLGSIGPSLEIVAQWFSEIGTRFDAWITSLSNSGELQQFFQIAARELVLWFNIIMELGEMIFNILTPLLPLGHAIATIFLNMISQFNAFAQTALGQQVILQTTILFLSALATVLILVGALVFMLVAPFLAVGVAIGAFVYAINEALKMIPKLADNLRGVANLLGPDSKFGWALQKLADLLDFVAEKIPGIGEIKMPDLDGPKMDTSKIDEFTNKWKEAQRAQEEAQRVALTNAALSAYDAWKNSAGDVAKAINNVTQAQARQTEANEQAAQRVVDAQKRVKEAAADVLQAQKDLNDARAEAVRRLRDQADAEEGASISVERAKQRLIEVNMDPEADELDRRSALLDLKNAQDELIDTTEDGAKLRAEGDEGVKTAKERLKTAIDNQKKATDDLKTAQADQTRVQREQTTAVREAKTALNEARVKQQELQLAMFNAAGQAGLTTTQLRNMRTEAQKLETKYEMQIGVKGIDKVQTALQYMEALRLMKIHPEWSAEQAWNAAAISLAVTAAAKKIGAGLKKAFSFEDGGPAIGAGTSTSDSIHAMLSNGEHVWTAAEVRAAGGHAAVLRMRQATMRRRYGGPVVRHGFARGGAVGLSSYLTKGDTATNNQESNVTVNQTINNPVKEPASVSGPKALRRAASKLGRP